MKVAVLGLWHLGTVTAACVADSGIQTIAIDDDAERIAALGGGEPPLFEPGLAELVRSGIEAKRLAFSTDASAVAGCQVVWVCFDTPVDDEDRADTDYVYRRVEQIFDHIDDGCVVLVSSQLPVGSIAKLEKAFSERGSKRRVSFACSPENLRLGQAIQVFTDPGRIVVGVRDDATRATLTPLLERLCPNLIWMRVESAEMVKHGLNSFLAVSITFTNEVATICEAMGADAAEVEAGLRSDLRIGQRAYVKAGPSFAGGTLARDINFLSSLAEAEGLSAPVIGHVLASNRSHANWSMHALERHVPRLQGLTVGVLGLAYKPGTSTLRRSTAVEFIRALIARGAKVRAFDPKVEKLPDDLAAGATLVPIAEDVAAGADVVVIATEWPEFKTLDADKFASAMRGTLILDPSRHLEKIFARPPFQYFSVGRVS